MLLAALRRTLPLALCALNRPADFDDEADDAHTFSGVRASYGFGPQQAWRIVGSVYRNARDVARVGVLAGEDDRISTGIRLFGAQNGWDQDVEAYHQSGEVAGRDIQAWGGGGDLGYSFQQWPAKPRLGLRWLVGSGDEDPSDGQAGTFVGPLRTADLLRRPTVAGARQHRGLGSRAGPQAAAGRLCGAEAGRHPTARARRLPVRRPPHRLPEVGGPARRLGLNAATLSAHWTPKPELTIQLHHVEQEVTGALRSAGGKDSRFTAVSVATSF